jgi:two-component system chemotaxis response regulator CheB
MINVLIADDSAFMRLAIDKMLSRDPDINISGFCINGPEVLVKLETLRPDVLTLDIEMPEMNGLQVLEIIMSNNPLPVIMVSSMTGAGTEETVRALELGAIDVVAKPDSFNSLKITDIFDELTTKIKTAAKAKVFKQEINTNTDSGGQNGDKNKNSGSDFKPELIIIGTSTGGPLSLQKIIPELPGSLPCCIIVAQHMPVGFTRALADRLNQNSALEVKEAANGDMIKPGRVLIAPSGYQTRIKKRYVGYCTEIVAENDKDYLYKPCIDHLFSSAAETFKDKVLGIIMTGMGDNGTRGAIDINQAGGKIFVQSGESCVIPSMPNSVVKAGVSDKIYPLDLIAKSIIELF